MPNVAMLHEVDPKTEILKRLGNTLDGFEILNNEVLLAIYLRPEKTRGGIVVPQKTRNEDLYQGKAGLVVKVGPSCDFPTVPIFLHDWVMIRASDSLGVDILSGDESISCRLVMDKFIRAKLSHPELAW